MLRFATPFIASLKEVFKVMLKEEVRVHSPVEKSDRVARGDVTSVIGVTGEVRSSSKVKPFAGLLALSFSEKVYISIANQVLGENYTAYTSEISDVGSELANIILGKSKPALVEQGFTPAMTSPSTIRGKDLEINFPLKSYVVEVTVDSRFGSFHLDLSYQE